MGTFFYIGNAVNSPTIIAISAITAQQANFTEPTLKKSKHLFDYCTLQDEDVLTYKTRNMVLGVHNDEGYLNEWNSCSWAGGHFFLSNNLKFPQDNGAILNVMQKIRKGVMSFATKAKLEALYINTTAIHLHQ